MHVRNSDSDALISLVRALSLSLSLSFYINLGLSLVCSYLIKKMERPEHLVFFPGERLHRAIQTITSRIDLYLASIAARHTRDTARTDSTRLSGETVLTIDGQ